MKKLQTKWIVKNKIKTLLKNNKKYNHKIIKNKK